MARTIPLTFLLAFLLLGSTIVVQVQCQDKIDGSRSELQSGCFETDDALSYSEVVRCFEDSEFKPEITDQLFDSLEKYLTISSFINYLKDPPAPFKHMKIDQLAELNKLREKSNRGEYQFEYERQLDLVRLYTKFKDPHQIYRPFKFSNVHYVLLGYAQPKFVNDRTKFTFGVLESCSSNYITLFNNGLLGEKASSYEKILSCAGQDIVKINGAEPLEFFKSYADQLGISYDLGVSMNHAWDVRFATGSLDTTGIFKDTMITFEFSGCETVHIPYIYQSKSPVMKPPVSSDYGSGKYSASSRFSGEMREEAREEENEEEAMDNQDTSSIISEDSFSSQYEIIQDYPPLVNFTIQTYRKKGTTEYIGLLVLRSFHISNDIDLLTSELKKIAEGKNDYTLSKLVIDVRNNLGGEIHLNTYLNSWLNWDISEPNSISMRTDVDDYRKWMVENSEKIPSKSDLWSLRAYDVVDFSKNFTIADLYADTRDVTIGGWYEDEEETQPQEPIIVHRTRTYTWFNSDLPINKELTVGIDGYYQQIFDFDRVDVTIISNGVCGSACALFLWLAKELGTARIVTVGGARSDTEDIIPQFHSFAGGVVLSSGGALDKLRDEAEKQNIDISPLPGPLPEGVSTSYIYDVAYSLETPEIPYQFKEGKGDFHLFHYSQPFQTDYSVEYPELFDKVFAVLDDHEHYSEEEKAKDIKRTDAIKDGTDMDCQPKGRYVYGRRWDGSAYAGECVELYCRKGYYKDFTSKECLDLPTMKSVYGKGDDTLVYVFGGLSVVFLGTSGGLATALTVSKKKKEKGIKGDEEEMVGFLGATE